MTASIPMLPDTPHLSWVTSAVISLVLIDVSTEIGEYHRAIDESWKGCDDRKLRQARKAVNRTAMQVIAVIFCFVAASGLTVTYLTRDMDWRMTLVLEGISRLEAAWFWFHMSVRTPCWIGVYYSPAKQRRIQHVGRGIRTLRFHVCWSIAQYFFFVFCYLLPFCGRPRSFILGVFIGITIEGSIKLSRKRSAKQQAQIAIILSLALALVSSILFADGWHYIQQVWGTRIWQNELGLALVTFPSCLSAILLIHYRKWRETEKRFASSKRFSAHAKNDRMAISLIYSHVFGSRVIPPSALKKIQDEDAMRIDEEEEDEEGLEHEQSTWELIKRRWSSPSELVILSKAEVYVAGAISVLSLFVTLVNICATSQMNVVREHFHSVHETLYGQMEVGPVCAFDKLGGDISTFDSQEAAHQAGYKIAHCGACGACSDWHNLRLQYTTREYLAKESARCARKSLTGGRDAVLNCLGEEPIGFSGKCAECWTEDIFCARGHCAFIFIQSNMINTFANFQVGVDTITAATCEEAMCELEFVPCSGANRRRMAIQSTIKRPGNQLCNIVDVDWAEVFGTDNLSFPSDAGSVKEEL